MSERLPSAPPSEHCLPDAPVPPDAGRVGVLRAVRVRRVRPGAALAGAAPSLRDARRPLPAVRRLHGVLEPGRPARHAAPRLAPARRRPPAGSRPPAARVRRVLPPGAGRARRLAPPPRPHLAHHPRPRLRPPLLGAAARRPLLDASAARQRPRVHHRRARYVDHVFAPRPLRRLQVRLRLPGVLMRPASVYITVYCVIKPLDVDPRCQLLTVF